MWYFLFKCSLSGMPDEIEGSIRVSSESHLPGCFPPTPASALDFDLCHGSHFSFVVSVKPVGQYSLGESNLFKRDTTGASGGERHLPCHLSMEDGRGLEFRACGDLDKRHKASNFGLSSFVSSCAVSPVHMLETARPHAASSSSSGISAG